MTDGQSETDSTAENTQSNFQFQLWHLFFATTLFAIAMSIEPWLLVPAVSWILVCYFAGQPDQLTNRVSRLAISVPFVCCFLGPVALMPPLSTPPLHAKRAWCSNNVRQLQLAILNYESAHREFPQAAELSPEGKPMHSWRVRVLPFVEEKALYDQYDFTQPWDSPANSKLLDQMPDCFRCPCSKETNRTQYKLVVGPGSLFDGGERTFRRIQDGLSNTIAIVEDGQNPVEWTRPSDLSVDEAIAALNPKDLKSLPHVQDSTFSTIYAPGVVGFFDGSTEYAGYFSGADPTVLRNMFLINDGNIVDRDKLIRKSSHFVPKYGPRVAAVAFLIMMLYPLSWVFRRDHLVPAEQQDA